MKTYAHIIFVIAALTLAMLRALGGCGPAYPPLPPPEPQPGTCESACATKRALGGCGDDVSNCEQDCHDAEQAEAEIGIRHPVGCLTAAKSCDERRACGR